MKQTHDTYVSKVCMLLILQALV